MKIAYVTWLDAATTDYPLFLTQEWQKLGCEVLLMAPDLDFRNEAARTIRGRIALRNKALGVACLSRFALRRILSFKPDILIIAGLIVEPHLIDTVRRAVGCQCGFVLGYDHLQLGNTAEFVERADFLVVHDSHLLPVLGGEGAGRKKHVLLNVSAASPDEHRPIELSGRDAETLQPAVAFVGGCSPNRVETLRTLLGHGLRVWGPGWDGVPGFEDAASSEPIFGLKKTKLYSGAKIVINLEDSSKQVHAFSQRVPEVLACGGFVLSEYKRDLGLTKLVPGESLAVFSGAGDLQSQVEHYLGNDAERTAISVAGREIVLSSMTYAHRAAELLEGLELVIRDP